MEELIGYSMEEQREIRKNLPAFHLTEKFQYESADKLIKSLRIKLGESESYIQELEEKLKVSEINFNTLQEKHNSFLNKYSLDMSELRKEPVIAKLVEENKKLEHEIKVLRNSVNSLIERLNHE